MWLMWIDCASGVIAAFIIYSLFFHPLARVPGPLLARITPLWLVWKCIRNRRPALDLQLHRKYGSVVRIAPNKIIFSNPAYFKTVYGAQSARKWAKSPFLTVHNQHKHNYDRLNMLLESDIDKLRVQRRVLGPKYSTENAKKHESLINNNYQRWATRLRRLEGQVLDFYSELELVSIDLYCQMTFGEAYGAVERGDDGGQMKSMAKRSHWVGWVGLLPWLCALQHELMKRNVPFSQFKSTFPVRTWAARKMTQYASVEESSAQGGPSLSANVAPTDGFRSSIAHTMVDVSSTATLVIPANEGIAVPCLYTDLQIVSKTRSGVGRSWTMDMAMTNIGAGVDTTSWTLATVVFSVCAKPSAYWKLRAELDGALRSGLIFKDAPIPYDTAVTLPYLQACVKEAMRLWPNIAVSLARIVPYEGIAITGILFRQVTSSA